MTDTDGQDALNTDGQTPPAAARTEVSSLPSDVQDYIKRLNEENKARRLENEKLVGDMQTRRDAELAEQQRWQELAETRGAKLDELKTVQDHATDLEATLQTVLDAQVADLPTEAQQAVKDMPGTAKQKLEWLAVNRATLARTPAPAMHAGARGDSVPPDVKMDENETQAFEASGLTREQWNKTKRTQTDRPAGGTAFLDRLRANNEVQ